MKNRRRGILGQGLFWWVSKNPNEIMVWWWLNLEELCAGVFSKNRKLLHSVGQNSPLLCTLWAKTAHWCPELLHRHAARAASVQQGSKGKHQASTSKQATHACSLPSTKQAPPRPPPPPPPAPPPPPPEKKISEF
jgi:hypothetical protein